MENTIPLLPCPFCGSNNVEFNTFNYKESMYQDTYDSAIQCNDCEAKGGGVGVNIKYNNGRDITDYDLYKKEAIELWNKRPKSKFTKDDVIAFGNFLYKLETDKFEEWAHQGNTFDLFDIFIVKSNLIKDKNNKELSNGDIIDIKQTVNGQNLFVILTVFPLEIRYQHDIDRKYEYDGFQLIAPDKYTGETEFEIIGNIFNE